MDCHLPSTHFTLLAYFKEPDYDEWFDQLFDYEADCVWTDNEFKSMQQNRETWPTDCTATGYSDKYNNSIYMDVKPAAYGDMDIGFYIDELCLNETTDGTMNANKIFKGMNYGDDIGAWTLEAELEQWNSAFDVFKQCLPCKTGALTELVSGQAANMNGDRYSAFNNYTVSNEVAGDADGDRRLQNYGANYTFQCHGDLYDDVNQVSKIEELLMACSNNEPLTLSFVFVGAQQLVVHAIRYTHANANCILDGGHFSGNPRHAHIRLNQTQRTH